jgi:LAO/AO transport system kinase
MTNVTSLEPATSLLVEGLQERRPRQLAKLISRLESGGESAHALLAALYPRVGNAVVVGITGSPGAGKSTLVDRFARTCRERGETVGILAVDPSSPFTGGALLGDRVRMQELYTDPGVFIRSMATRGALGGLARASRDAVDLLDAAGFDWILIETVGVGQDEIDIVRSVDTVVVVVVPGMGDEIQAIKAGIMEIADIFVVNKADRAGADSAVRDIQAMLSMSQQESQNSERGAWRPPIVETVATANRGVTELRDRVEEHQRWLDETQERQRRRFAQLRLRVERALQEKILSAADRSFHDQLRVGFERHEDPYSLAERLFAVALASESSG